MMSTLLLWLSVGLVVACAVVVLSFHDIHSKAAYLLGVYLLSYAEIVFILELAGLFSLLTKAMMLGLEIALAAVCMLIWFRKGRPRLLQPFTVSPLSDLMHESLLLDTLKGFPELILLSASVAIVYFRNALEFFALSPRNWDSLVYHLSRVGFWLQYHSLYPWPTQNLRQTTFPMNAELGVLWTVLWWGTDQLAGFVQWLAVFVIVVGLFGLARLLGHSKPAAALTAMLWTTLAQVLYQSSTPQNDLVTTAFWVGMVFFFFAGLRYKSPSYFYFSGLAFGLAFGTKSTSLMVLPSMILVLLIVFWLYRKDRVLWRLILDWGLASATALILVGSYAYLQNIVAFGNPLGPSAWATRMTRARGAVTIPDRYYLMRDNVGRYVFQLVDLSPLPWDIAARINPLKKAVFVSAYRWIGIRVENPDTLRRSTSIFSLDYINPRWENESWFGPIMIFLMPAILYQGILGLRRRDALRIALALFAVGFLIVQSAAQAWTPAKGRYYMIPVALSFPLLGGLLEASTRWRRLTSFSLVLLGLVVMWTITSQRMAALPISWRQLVSGERADPQWADEFNYQMTIQNVPETASIGFFGVSGGFRDYPLFGEHFTRRVTSAVPNDPALVPNGDVARFAKDFEHSDFLFAGRNSNLAADSLSQNFYLLSRYGPDSLWIRADLRAAQECDDSKWPFTTFFEGATEQICPQFPVIIGEHVQIPTPKGNFSPLIRSGVGGGLEFGLLVKDERDVDFSIRIDPKDVRIPQTLQIMITGSDSQPVAYFAPFDKKEPLDFVIQLAPDTYKMQLTLSDGSVKAEISKIRITVR